MGAPNHVENDQSVLSSKKYLEVTYSESRAPKNEYPYLLCQRLLQHYYKKTGTLLEMGCGRGDHLKIFQQIGFTVSGIDISEAARDFAQGYQVAVADFERDPFPYPSESFDFVFSKSVIEHMRHPSCLLAQAFEALKPGGVAVIMTPSWAHTYWGPFYIDHTHVSPFTAPSLTDAMTICGFTDVRTEHFYQLPFLWKLPFLKAAVKAFAAVPLRYRPYQDASWPDGFNKLIRFSKEVMLLSVARKPER